MDRSFEEKLIQYTNEGKIPSKYKEILLKFYQSYLQALSKQEEDSCQKRFLLFLELIAQQYPHPYSFEPVHRKIRAPVDYYAFGQMMVRPLIDFKISSIEHRKNLDKIGKQLHKKENVILFANHQTETDPQIISLLLEKTHPLLAEEMFFVAGERVLQDPMAIPFSMGRNLICIYSKKHIDNVPELKAQKQQHNQRTIQMMSQLLKQGGVCIYVAPSGGRDRPGPKGVVEVAPFDPDSIEMFRLIGKRAKTPCHFYPMALATYDILPPPDTLGKELGEKRITKRAGVHLAFGEECDMEVEIGSKTEKRQALADQIWKKVCQEYELLMRKDQ